MNHLLTLAINDSNLETPFRNLAVSEDGPALDIERTLDRMYEELKKSYMNVLDEKACIVHKYREKQEDQENK